MMGRMSELDSMLRNGDSVEEITDWLIQLNFNRGTHITRTEAHGTAARFWVQYHENETNVLLNIGEEE